ncbi:MAG: cadherin-like domain-containing protein [Clostridia bacterium]|nr:cadherin-like domain-containing protein [Clostridia bacterium]
MKKILLLLLLISLSVGVGTVSANAALFGTGAEVIANDVTMIKTGLIGEPLSFCDTDFKSALALAEFKKIIISEIPSSADGRLTLDGKRVYIGQEIKRKNLSSLTFTPQSDEVTEASFKFKVDSKDNTEHVCTVRFAKKVNYAPKINTDTAETLSVTTQKGISVYGKISASDPEGDELSVIVVSYPKNGTLTLTGEGFGEFCYTPKRDYDGKDSFVFVVRDEYGNYTKPEKVSLRVTERMSEVVYVDMTESKSYNAAVAMTAMGIMSGSRIGDDMYFSPAGTVTRAEFVAMAMKALGIRQDSTLTKTYFDDNDKIPKSLVGYVATAARIGAVNGSFDTDGLYFRPNDNITKCEAAIIMANLLELKSDSSVFSEIEGITDVPVWARSSVGAMFSIGVFDSAEDIDMNEALSREAAAEYLYRIAQK